MERKLENTRGFWLANIAVWTVTAALSSAYAYAFLRDDAPYTAHLIFHLAGWAPWVLLTWVVFRIARRFPVTREGWKWAALAQAGNSLVWIALYSVYIIGLQLLLTVGSLEGFWTAMRARVGFWLWFEYLYVWGVVAAAYAVLHLVRSQRAEAQAALLERAVRDAELRYRVQQLQPHFLFNAINAVTALVRTGRRRAALDAIDRLSALLRYALEIDAADTVPLARELTAIERFVEVDRLRFDDDLAMRVEIDVGALSSSVPPMILQPLVENALRYGTRSAGSRSLTVRAHRHGSRLSLEIENPIDDRATNGGHGIGLDNVRARLRALYGADFGLSMERARGVATVRLELPAEGPRGIGRKERRSASAGTARPSVELPRTPEEAAS